MQTQHKINRAGQESKVLQELPRENRIRRQLSFFDFVANRGKLGFGSNSRRAKAVSEEIIGDFDNQEISMPFISICLQIRMPVKNRS